MKAKIRFEEFNLGNLTLAWSSGQIANHREKIFLDVVRNLARAGPSVGQTPL